MEIIKTSFVIMSNKRTRILKGRGTYWLELIDATRQQIRYFNSEGEAKKLIKYNHGTLTWVDKTPGLTSREMFHKEKCEIIPVTITTTIPEK
jgi:hypothetical protein